MATSTTRLGLRKPDGTDAPDVAQDLNANYDKIDVAAGVTIATSSARPSTALFAGRTIFETDTGNVLVYTGSAWRHFSVPVVGSTGAAGSPYEGQLIYVTADNMLYRYVSSAWVACVAMGTTLHEARYYQSTTQTVNGDTPINFQTASYTSSDVTASGTGNNVFTLNRAGLWIVEAGVRYAAATSGERHAVISRGNLTERLAGSGDVTSQVATVNVGTEHRFAAGDTVRVYGFTPAAVDTSLLGQYTFISLTWLRP